MKQIINLQIMMALQQNFYKHFSNELVPVHLDVYNSKRKLGTIGVASRTRIIYLPYTKKIIKKTLQTIDPFHF